MMKRLNRILFIYLASVVALAACTDNPARQYGNTMVQSLKSAKDVDNKVNVQQVQKSIQEFYAANGRYPSDLNELSTFNGITVKSDNYDYDPSTGAITEKK
jgi:hypothetical protein